MHLRTDRPSDDAGIAMVAVIGAFVVVVALVLGSVGYLAASVRFARLEQDTTAADAAVQSGIHDFLTRMRLDRSYLDDADPASTDPENFCRNPAAAGPGSTLPADADGTPVCAWDSGTPVGWTAVEAGAEASLQTPSFHYRVTSYDAVRRDVEIEVVGRSRDVHRTQRARIAYPSTADYLYFSDYELADPEDPAAYPANPHYPGSQDASAACGGAGHTASELRYAWAADGPRTYAPAGDLLVADCLEPTFVAGDVLDGRVHSNDTIRSTGADFRGLLSSANPGCAALDPVDQSSWLACLHPVDDQAALARMPVYESAPLTMRDTTTDLDEASAAGAGCRYLGATRIVLHAGGTMTVWSKDSTAASTPGTACGTPGAGAGQLGSAGGATVALPADGLVYVADTPAGAGSRQLHGQEIGGPPGRELPLGDYAGQAAFAGAAYSADISFAETDKHSGFGNLYLEGVADGWVTFGAAKSVVLTGDVVLAGGRTGDDVVGIVAGRSVEVFRPRMVQWRVAADSTGDTMWVPARTTTAPEGPAWPTRYAEPGGSVQPATGLQVNAAMIALSGSVRAQRWSDPGLEGTLEVFGSVAQRFRGTVAALDAATGAAASGYTKHFTYDDRLSGPLRPPYFPPLAGEALEVRWTQEISTDAQVRAS